MMEKGGTNWIDTSAVPKRMFGVDVSCAYESFAATYQQMEVGWCQCFAGRCVNSRDSYWLRVHGDFDRSGFY